MRSQPILACLVKTDFDSKDASQSSIVVAQRLAYLMKSSLNICVGAVNVVVATIIAPVSIEKLTAAENTRRLNAVKLVCKAAEVTHLQAPIQQTCDIVFGDPARIRKALLRRAKSHGIVVTETGIAADMMEFDIIQRLLFESGRPVLVVPRLFKPEISLTTVLVAWDGGENATRAVWNALPVMNLSSRVVICLVKGEKNLDGDAGAEDLAVSLRGMGINAEVAALELKGKNVADTLRSEAEAISAGIIVLGAYGHSRWREFIFGGVTRDMLRFSKIPMFMSN